MKHFTKFFLLTCFLMLTTQLSWAEFRNFSVLVDNSENSLLTAAEKETQWTPYSFGIAVADDGTVTRVEEGAANSVATVSGKSHSEHGSSSLKVVVPVEGKVTISVATCTFSTGDITVTDANGKVVASATPEATCWKNDHSKFTVLNYKGGATTLTISGMSYCAMVSVEKVEAATVAEKSIFKTNFQNWEAVASSTTETQVTKATTDNQELVFSLMETEVKPDGTHTKFTAECITPGYLMAAKTATPYIKTSVLKSVTKVNFVHAATGSNRGWGLKVKGDGDADWVTVSNAVANPSGGMPVSVDVNRTNVQLWFYNLNAKENAYMTSLEILGKVDKPQRNFTDFKIDFRTNPYTVLLPENNQLPSGVTIDPGTFNGNQHGCQKANITVPVDGPVKFTIGGCSYTNNATVTINGGTPIKIDNNSPGCDVSYTTTGTYNKYVTYIYNETSAATLVFDLGDYCPYFFAEACEQIPMVTIKYYDTDGTTFIGEETVEGNSALKYKYNENNVTVKNGYKFRGWFNKASGGNKVSEGENIIEDINLYAVATEIEVPDFGKTFEYNFKIKNFYPEDHEGIKEIVGGTYHSSSHGWIFSANGSITIPVVGKSKLTIEQCGYGSNVLVKNGNTVLKEIIINNTGEGDKNIVEVEYSGSATDLVITGTSTFYIHNLKVENYNLPSPDMKILPGKGDIVLSPGQSYQITKDVDFTDLYASDDTNYTYTSSDPTIADVDAKGKIQAANKYGQVVITVSHPHTVDYGEGSIKFNVIFKRLTNIKPQISIFISRYIEMDLIHWFTIPFQFIHLEFIYIV